MPELAFKACYTRDEVRRMLPVTERQLKSWERHDLIPRQQTFALSDLIALRALMKLQRDGVPFKKVRLAFTAIRERLRGVNDPWSEIKVLSDGKRIRVEFDGRHIEPISGQLLFNFDGKELRRLLSFPGGAKPSDARLNREKAERYFQQGLDEEQRGEIQAAIKSYETAIHLDNGSAGAWLNLGTIHFNARQFVRAESHYQKALEADPNYALAHFNIANLYDERGDYPRAVQHYLSAVRLNPTYADAYYNLALLCQGSGHVMDAVRHWKTYLKLDPGSAWGVIARRELEKLRKSTVVQGSKTSRRSKGNAAD